MTDTSILDRARTLSRFDPRPRHAPPRAVRVLAATVASVVVSLAADALLVVIGTAVFPSTKGYMHFAFGDYSTLTVLGVLAACAAWPIVTRLSSAPRWVFVRLAVLVSAVLLVPDVAIWVQGQSGEAVVVLMAMHLAIGLVTYNLLVRVAPVTADDRRHRRTRPEPLR